MSFGTLKSKFIGSFNSKNLKDVTMGNQQETKFDYLVKKSRILRDYTRRSQLKRVKIKKYLFYFEA